MNSFLLKIIRKRTVRSGTPKNLQGCNIQQPFIKGHRPTIIRYKLDFHKVTTLELLNITRKGQFVLDSKNNNKDATFNKIHQGPWVHNATLHIIEHKISQKLHFHNMLTTLDLIKNANKGKR